jgi:two-component system NtrC family sensor kinase
MADERQRRSLEAIETAAKRGASLTRQLLSFSRRQTHEPTAIDLRHHLPQLQDMLRSSLRGDIAVETDIPDDLWPIRVDLSEFELAVLNLAVNARDAMPGGGRLVLAAQNISLSDAGTIGLSGDYVALSLTDTGAGIPPDVLARVFEPFFTTKEVGKGTGLGLSQVYGFAKQSGGTATIASQPGRGTTVTLYLRRTRDEAPAAPPTQDTPTAPAGGPRGHVLLVEDNADVAEITHGRLLELGYRVTHAPDGSSALASLERLAGSIDLVFSDIVMPGDLSGLDLVRQVRRRYGEGVPVLLATGYSDVAQTAAHEGFLLLRKPYEAAEMREAIAKALRTARLKAVGHGSQRNGRQAGAV